MRWIITIVLLVALSSCSPVYRELDKNNKTIAPEAITLKNCTIDVDLTRKVAEDKADYHLYVIFKPLINNLHLKPSDIKVRLSAYRSGRAYKPVDIKILKDLNPVGQYGRWIPPVPTFIDSSQTLDLKPGNRDQLMYSFSGHHHRLLQVEITVHINGETVQKTIIFKRFTEVELLH